jgi:hypothetical protein
VRACDQFQEHGVGSRSGVAIDDELHLYSAPPHLEGDQPGEFEASRPATSQVLKRFSWQLDGQLNAILLQLHAVNEKLQRTGCFALRAKAAAPCACGVVAAHEALPVEPYSPLASE